MVGILSLLCVCTVTDFSAAEKGSGVKLRTLVRLLSGMNFSHFGNFDLGAARPGMRALYGGICLLLTHLLMCC